MINKQIARVVLRVFAAAIAFAFFTSAEGPIGVTAAAAASPASDASAAITSAPVFNDNQSVLNSGPNVVLFWTPPAIGFPISYAIEASWGSAHLLPDAVERARLGRGAGNELDHQRDGHNRFHRHDPGVHRDSVLRSHEEPDYHPRWHCRVADLLRPLRNGVPLDRRDFADCHVGFRNVEPPQSRRRLAAAAS